MLIKTGWKITMLPGCELSPEATDDVFLIDHAWTYQGEGMARGMLMENEQLLQRLVSFNDS
jgi:hypothetical protein